VEGELFFTYIYNNYKHKKYTIICIINIIYAFFNSLTTSSWLQVCWRRAWCRDAALLLGAAWVQRWLPPPAPWLHSTVLPGGIAAPGWDLGPAGCSGLEAFEGSWCTWYDRC